MKKLLVLTAILLFAWAMAWAAPEAVNTDNEAAAAASPTIESFLQQAAAQQAVQAPPPEPYVQEQPMYGKNGERVFNGQTIMLNGQQNGNGQVIPGIMSANLLPLQTFHQPNPWQSPNIAPAGGWIVLDSGSEGTEFWTWDKWHKFYYNATGWYDTVFASNYAAAAGAVTDSIIDNWLITPVFDLSSATTDSIIFKQYYLPNTASGVLGDSAKVLISVDNGVTWNFTTPLLTQTAATANPLVSRINLAALGGTNSQVKLAFRHVYKVTGGSSTATNGWVLDDITLKVNGSNVWVQNCSNVMSGWYGDTPPAGPGGAWTIVNNCIPPTKNAAGNSNDWNRRVGNLLNDTVASCTRNAGKYAEFENEWMISPSFTTTTNACTLSFNENWQIDFMGNYFPPNTSVFPEHGYVKIQETTDAGATWGPWQIVVDNSTIAIGGSNLSTPVKYSLDAWLNKTCRIAFQKVGPPELSSGTWYIKDVSVDDYTPVLDNVGTSALTAPLMATPGRNFPIKSRVFNNGQNAETFQDSAWIYNVPPGATVMSTGFENAGAIPAGWTDASDGQTPAHPWYVWSRHCAWSRHCSWRRLCGLLLTSTAMLRPNDSLISPSMDLSSLGGNYVLTFWYWHSSGPADSITVFLDQAGVKTRLWNPGSTRLSSLDADYRPNYLHIS